MPEIHVARGFTLTHDDGRKVVIAAGKQSVDQDVADHFYTKAHLVGAKPNPAAGTPAFLRAAAEERARLESERALFEAETDARVTAHVREKMEAEMGERMRIAQVEQAKAAADVARGKDAEREAEIERRVAAAKAEMEATFDARVKEASDAAVLAHMEAEDAKARESGDGETDGGKGKGKGGK